MNSLRIIAESHIPFITGVFERAGCRVSYLASSQITHAAAMEADCIVTRTRTRCDASLLAGTPVRLVVTATIGTDHIDTAWCHSEGIKVVNAPGCNAPAVAQYVLSSLATLANRRLSQYTLGIIGVGHVGNIVCDWARAMGMEVLCCDPPRERAEGGSGWCDMAEIAERSDVITVHTPLNNSGIDATYHLINADFLSQCRRSPIVVNAARGGIVDEEALLQAMDCGAVHKVVMDCWEGEPDINRELLSRAAIATPHIAGYSRQGKVRATAVAVEAVSEFFGLENVGLDVDVERGWARQVSVGTLLASYNPLADTMMLRREIAEHGAAGFEAMRNGYALREEPKCARLD